MSATMEKFDELMRLLPPPQEEVTAPPWRQSRSEIGVDFPQDYREFVDRYGGGSMTSESMFLEFSVLAPCSLGWKPDAPGGFDAFTVKQIEQIRPLFVFDGADENYWGGTAYPVHPDPGGLLAWGENQEGDVFFWLTDNPDPDRWPVVMWARGPATTYRFEGGMVAFLLALFRGDLPASDWLGGPELEWTMKSDWLRRGLAVSAGPAG
ncbi:SMI1/KNR4 family protein [Streptacidiphilus sp. PAMC 29251]